MDSLLALASSALREGKCVSGPPLGVGFPDIVTSLIAAKRVAVITEPGLTMGVCDWVRQ